MFSSYTIEEAKNIIKGNIVNNLDIEEINIEDCLGRTVAEDIISSCNVPGFKRSVMDGYAVRYSDTRGASREQPAKLKLVGEVEMAKQSFFEIGKDECGSIPTGGMIPSGADSVIMIENTSRQGDNDILLFSETKEGENIVSEDEDVSCGSVVLKKGKIIRPYEIGVLSSIGCTRLKVFKRPRIGILATGNEILSPYEMPKPGQVRDINSYLFVSFVLEAACTPVKYNSVNDDFNGIFRTVSKAVNECDILLISGGSSVGVKDQTLKVLKEIPGMEILIHGLALKPGKPTIVAKCGEKMIFGMPGHPLSGAVVYKTLVNYYLNTLMYHDSVDYPILCNFADDYKKAKDREEYIPVKIEIRGKELFAVPIVSKSAIISTFSKAWGYVKTHRDDNIIYAGDMVEVFRL